MIAINKTDEPNKYEIVIEMKGKSFWISEDEEVSRKTIIGNVWYTSEDEERRISFNDKMGQVVNSRCLKLGLDAFQAIKNLTLTAEDVMMLSYLLNQETADEAFKFFEAKLVAL